MSIPSALAEVAGALASFLNPKERERRVLRRAIEVANELFLIYKKEGEYKDMSTSRYNKVRIHYEKQWRAWSDGQ